MTFRSYLRLAHAHDNPRGDFIRDARADRRLPEIIDDWPALRAYLRDCQACDEAWRSARLVWRQYQRYVRVHA